MEHICGWQYKQACILRAWRRAALTTIGGKRPRAAKRRGTRCCAANCLQVDSKKGEELGGRGGVWGVVWRRWRDQTTDAIP